MKPLILLLFVVFLAISCGASAQGIPPLVNYQGRLTDQTGAPLSSGIYSIQFRLWDSTTATNSSDLIWAQQQTLAVQTNGVFSVILGSPGGSSIPGTTPAVNNLAYAFTGSNCFLGVTVTVSNGVGFSGASEILPRQQLLSVPFAFQAQQAFQAQVASLLVSNLANALCPPGTVVAYMGTSAPPGWLLCDGSLVNRTTYSSLFAVMGTASGSGDGATTFNLPDMRGVFLRGVNGSRSDAFADPDDVAFRINVSPGGNTGNAVGSYQADMFASHNHSYWEPAANVVNAIPNINGTNPGAEASQTGSTGGNETRPKNIYVNYIIKY